MIHYIKIKNFRSIKDEIELTFEAGRERNFRENYVRNVAGLRLLRLGIIYGANASGKSNVLKAIDYVRTFVLQKQDDKNNKTGRIPFLFDKDTIKQPSEFEISFITNNRRYVYILKLDDEKVVEEKLSVYISHQPTEVFNRKDDNGVSKINFNENKIKISQAEKGEIEVKCLPNMSVFAAYNQVNTKIKEMEEAMDWIIKGHQNPINEKIKLFEYAEEKLLEDSELKQKVVNELRNGDFNIVDIKTEVEEKPISEGFIENLISLNPNITEEQKEELKKVNTIRATKTEFAHKVIDDKGQESNYFLPRGLESQGTIRMFGIATVLKTITKKDSFITIDEIESSMHPRLVEYIITEFLNEESNSQLLVTTHYDGLLEEKDLIRNDAIWFTSKKDNGATDLYPLSDFRGLSRISSLRKAYRVNSFGAQPNI